ncbi:MAG TPA: DUF362 domain-containing protein [Opitutaceae bacterium]|nr:DUF362 domain-containing protein [Opitutaceae bacterium]
MRLFPIPVLLLSLLAAGSAARADMPSVLKAGAAPQATTPALPPPKEVVWEARLQNFDAPIYEREVEKLITQFEASTGRHLVPGAKRKVGLKIYTDSGPGVATPKALVHAVIDALERRGFESQNIFLVGLNQLRLRMTGYLPSLVKGETEFKGHPVYVLESGRYYDPVWFYPSPLPEHFDPIFAASQTRDVPNTSTKEEDRNSYLATPLFLDADFWINLPVYTDHPTLGVNGSLVNATLWNASNTARFFRSPASAPEAVAEMSAIPELRSTWVFSIVSLERYQFIGGPYFNSLYTVSEPLIWLSTDPVMLDSLMLERMNKWRQKTGFQPISDEIPTLQFAEQLGVGSTKTDTVKMIHLGE